MLTLGRNGNAVGHKLTRRRKICFYSTRTSYNIFL